MALVAVVAFLLTEDNKVLKDLTFVNLENCRIFKAGYAAFFEVRLFSKNFLMMKKEDEFSIVKPTCNYLN